MITVSICCINIVLIFIVGASEVDLNQRQSILNQTNLGSQRSVMGNCNRKIQSLEEENRLLYNKINTLHQAISLIFTLSISIIIDCILIYFALHQDKQTNIIFQAISIFINLLAGGIYEGRKGSRVFTILGKYFAFSDMLCIISSACENRLMSIFFRSLKLSVTIIEFALLRTIL